MPGPVPIEDTWDITNVVSSSTGPFAFTFKYFEKADLTVYVDDVALDAADWSVTPGSSDTYAGFIGGSVTLNSAVANAKVTIAREMDAEREANLTGAQLTASAINSRLNEHTMHLQDLKRDLTRAILAVYGSTGSSFVPADIAALAAIATEIGQVADIDTEVLALAAITTEILAIYADISGDDDIGTVATALNDGTITNLLDGQVGKFDTLVEQQAYTTAVDGQIMFRSSRATAGDGGAGFFRFSSSDESTNVSADEVTTSEGDGGIWVAPGTDKTGASGAWELLFKYPIRPELYGAKFDAVNVTDGAITASDNTLTSATAAFTSADVGKLITVEGAAAAGADLSTTIASYTSATEVELTAAASTTVSGADVWFGSDNLASLQAAVDAALLRTPAPIDLSKGTALVSGTWTWGGDGLNICGAGPHHTTIMGVHAAGDIIHIDGSLGGVARKNIFAEKFRVDSAVTKTSGAGIHAERTARSTFEHVVLSGQDGTAKLYTGIHFDTFDLVKFFNFEIFCIADGLLANGGGSGGDLFVEDGKIVSSAGYGTRWAGDCGGVRVERVDMNNCALGSSIIDQSQVPSGNRQVTFGDGCAFDGESVMGVRQQPGLICDDPDLENVFLNTCWFSVNTYGIWIKQASSSTTRIHILGGRNGQCDDDAIRIDEVPRLLKIDDVDFYDATGWAINCTVDASNQGVGEGIIIGPSNRFRNNTGGDVRWENIPPMPGTSFYVKIDDDDIFAFKPRDLTTLGAAGLAYIGIGASATRAFFYYRASSGVAISGIESSGITLTTGALTGTTGADGTTTVAVHTDEKITIENRTGSTQSYIVTLVGGAWPSNIVNP